MTREELLNSLKQDPLKTPRVVAAFEAIDRADFVIAEFADMAYEDTALPIGHEATISQPYTVAFMLEKLQPEPGQAVLDVGSGSGWSAALLAQCVGEQGGVVATEIIPELVEMGKKNCAKYHLKNIEFLNTRETLRVPERGPFDRILVSASAGALPEELVSQLKPGGRLVIPIQNSIWKVDKTVAGKIFKEEFPGFAFVPLR